MPSSTTSLTDRVRAFVIAVACLLAFGTTACAQDETAPLHRSGDFVGTAECARCHGPQQRKLLRNPHGAVLALAELHGCETCHGPGRAHADDEGEDPALVTMPAKLTMLQQEALCATCHRDQIAAHGGDIDGLRHAGKSCTDCHEIHRASEPATAVAPPFRSRADAALRTVPVGSTACVACHPLRDARLAHGGHARFQAARKDDGCESCHGNGELHVATNGRATAITRPDRAMDGIATCRECHAEVDAHAFHWPRGLPAHLGKGASCTTCHRVHASEHADAEGVLAAVAAPAIAPAKNRLCAECHVEVACTMPGSTHARLGVLDLDLAQGCGTCHSGGEAHAQRSGARALVSRSGGENAAQQAATCLRCHGTDPKLDRSEHGVHAHAEVACTDCHGPLHGATSIRTAKDAESTCATCHPSVAAEFALPNHHPVPEGRMGCSSCHDVHGERVRVRDLDLRERSCAQCHPRYAGPFVFAHQAGRRDGCVVCHVPHGSPNRRMLQQANSQQNCTACHGDFPAFHDQTTGAVFTDCLRCHTEVHGSNHSRLLFR